MVTQERPRTKESGFFAAASAFALDLVHAASPLPSQERKESTEVNLLEKTDYIIFDWDGVLFNSTRREHAAVLRLLQERGAKDKVEELTVAEVEGTYDLPIWDYLRQYGVKVDGGDGEEGPQTKQIRAELTHYFRNVIRPQIPTEPGDDELYPEAVETIRALHESGKRLAIVSAGSAAKIEEVLEKNGLRGYFESIKGDAPNQDKTNLIAETTHASGIDPTRVTYFGDLPSDVRNTHGSGIGIKAVSVARSTRAEERLEGHNPDYLVTGVSMDNLKKARQYSK